MLYMTSSKRSKWLRTNWTRLGSTFRLKSPKYLPEKLNSWKDGQTTVVIKRKDNIVRMTIFPFWTADSEQSSWKSELPLCRNWLSKPKIISRYANRPRTARKIFKKNKVGGLSTLNLTTEGRQPAKANRKLVLLTLVSCCFCSELTIQHSWSQWIASRLFLSFIIIIIIIIAFILLDLGFGGGCFYFGPGIPMWDQVCLASGGKTHSEHNHKIKKKSKSCVHCTCRRDGAWIISTEESVCQCDSEAPRLGL